MKKWFRRGVIALVFAALTLIAFPQQAGRGSRLDQEEETTLPNGKLQKDEILKAEHRQNLKDASDLAALVEELRADLEKNDRYVLSMSTLKKTDDIEKLVKRIRARLRH